MSHFRVLALTNDVEEALRPYNEQDDEFFTLKDSTELEKKYYEKYKEEGETISEYLKRDGYKVVSDESEIEECENERRSFALVKNEELIKCGYFCNPNTKWDWWSDSRDGFSRYDMSDFILKKEFEDVDVLDLRVKHIDFKAMLEKERERNREDYRKYIEALGHQPNFKSWDMLHKEYGEDFGKTDKESKIYWEQPDVKVYTEKITSWGNPDEYLCTEDEYVNKATYPFYTIVANGEWYERGEMGWFAIDSNVKDAIEFNKGFEKILSEVHPETEVHVVDCHI